MRVADLATSEDLALMTSKEILEFTELLIADEAEELPRDFRGYIRAAWPIVEPEVAFVPGWHIDVMAEHLEAVSRGEIRKLLINVPPGHMKSLTVSVFWQTWEWTSRPSLRFLFASYAEELATRDSMKSRRIIESEWYQQRWGDKVRLARDQNLKTQYANTATGYRISGGLGLTGERGDRLVVDDPHNIKEIASDLAREGVLNWWDQVMSMRASDPKTAAKVIIMQRLHERDLAGHVLEEGDWTHLCLPAEYESGHPFVYVNDQRKQDGELLWPERYGAVEVAASKKTLGGYGAAGQLQQRPSPAGGGFVKRDWFRLYEIAPTKFDKLIQSVDCAFKETDDSDYVVMQVWGKIGADFYLLDQVRDRMDFPSTCQALLTLSKKWPTARQKLIEDKANGSAVIDQMKHRVSGLVAVNPEGGKASRLAAVSPLIEAGNVHLPNGAAWVHDFIEEFCQFPRGAHDDQVDSATQALHRLSHDPDRGIIDFYDNRLRDRAAKEAAHV